MIDKLIADINSASIGMAQTLGYSLEQVQKECTIREILLYLGTLRQVAPSRGEQSSQDDQPSAEDLEAMAAEFVAEQRDRAGVA